ncbi:MAG: hypothetical protein M0Z48_05480 [Nitrospiraceae bacterium]|nr:hypothetical protein [Nitrospiraceae bacterium]
MGKTEEGDEINGVCPYFGILAKGLLAESPINGAAGYMPSRAIETISVEDVIEAARTFGQDFKR